MDYPLMNKINKINITLILLGLFFLFMHLYLMENNNIIYNVNMPLNELSQNGSKIVDHSFRYYIFVLSFYFSIVLLFIGSLLTVLRGIKYLFIKFCKNTSKYFLR
jgi:hypothetical protein